MIQDHVHKLGIRLLQAVELHSHQARLLTRSIATTNSLATGTDGEIDGIIGKRKRDRKWPICRNRVIKFTNDEELKRIRFYKSQKHCHNSEPIPITDKNKEGRLACALCQGVGCQRKTRMRCATCLIPLCTTTNKLENKNCNSHFTKWHSVVDLVREQKRCNKKLRESRRLGTLADDNEEKEDDDDDGDHDDDDNVNSLVVRSV